MPFCLYASFLRLIPDVEEGVVAGRGHVAAAFSRGAIQRRPTRNVRVWYCSLMKKTGGKPRTHFEQIPLAVVQGHPGTSLIAASGVLVPPDFRQVAGKPALGRTVARIEGDR